MIENYTLSLEAIEAYQKNHDTGLINENVSLGSLKKY
jgi:hypothetical protein